MLITQIPTIIYMTGKNNITPLESMKFRTNALSADNPIT